MIKIPKILKTLPLSDYTPEFGGAVLNVWVNPPRRIVQEFFELQDAANQTKDTEYLNDIGGRISEILSEILSQGTEETRLSVVDINRMVEETIETDPAFIAWLIRQIVTMILQHRAGIKKN